MAYTGGQVAYLLLSMQAIRPSSVISSFGP